VRYAVREALAAFRRAPVLTGLSAAMVGLALFVLGLFGLVAHNVRNALVQAEERVEIVAYLRDDASIEDIDLARRELTALPSVSTVLHVTKTEALERVREIPEMADAMPRGVEVTPLPASLEIRLREGDRTREAVEGAAAAAAAFPFVEDVAYGREFVNVFFNLRRVAGVAAAVLGIAFAVVAVLIIGTALRIAIFARRDEIYVMRLVGARDSFIRRPFLLEGALAGFLGGLVALGFTFGVFRLVSDLLVRLDWLPAAWTGGGVVAGILFGIVASRLAVERHLREV